LKTQYGKGARTSKQIRRPGTHKPEGREPSHRGVFCHHLDERKLRARALIRGGPEDKALGNVGEGQ